MAGLAFKVRAGTVPGERGHLNADESEGFILATYREIAAHFALSGPNAARTKVKRAGWSAAPTNHPADPLHIRVPRDAWYQAAESPRPKYTERPHAISRDAPSPKADTPHIRALEAAVSSLTERAETAEKRADRAENRADRAEARADRAEQSIEAERNRAQAADSRADRAEQEIADERNRADRAEQGRDALRDRLITMQEQLADAHGALQAVEATAARADRAERDKEQAEAGREAERARVDALRDQVASLQAQLATAEAEAKGVNDRAWATGEQLAAAEQRAETERERADRLASSVAHERQDFLDAESRTRRELDGIRDRLKQAGESSEAASELRHQVEAAQIAQGEAEADAAELRQAEAARRARGLLARLRAAWRGE
jgi:chromosome segregation ATPase